MTIFMFFLLVRNSVLELKTRHQTPAIMFSHMCIYFLRTLKNKNYQNKKATSDAMLYSMGDGAS